MWISYTPNKLLFSMILQNLSYFFWLCTLAFKKKEHHPLKTRKYHGRTRDGFLFVVVAELAVVRRPSSLHPRIFFWFPPPPGWEQQHERPAVVVCERYNITPIAT